jgi:ParB family chromosome partitioning protein
VSDTPPDNPDKRTNLGRGLAALLGEEGDDDYGSLDKLRSSKQVPIERLHPSRVQPRTRFDEEALDTLADSIREQGILQPILVRRHPERPSDYEIVAGERRWRAAQKAQLHEVPVVIRELDDSTALELAIVENVQRQDLNPLEEAEGYRRLMEEFGHSQEALARLIGKSRPHIANTLRLLNLPDGVREYLSDGRLSAGHGRALLGAEEPEKLASNVVAKGLSVRETEKLAGAAKGIESKPRPRGAAKAAAQEKDADTLALERDLSAMLGLKVTIEIRGEGGTLAIHYNTLEQLDDVLHRLNQAVPKPAAEQD